MATPVNGDLDLRLTASRAVEVLGALDEPMLRFGHDGVFANLASPTAHGDRIVTSGTVGWKRVAGGRTYTWHAHRLHAAEPAGGGRFAVPLRVDGRRTLLRGTLFHHDPGTRWPWLVAPAALLAGGLASRPLRASALVAVVATAALRVGHSQTIATLVVGAAALVLLARIRSQEALGVAALAAGAAAVAQVIVSAPVLTRAIALNSLGTPGSRAALAVAFAAGVVAATAGGGVLVRSETP